MKKSLLFLFSFLLSIFSYHYNYAQDFAPVGAKWYYTEGWAFSWPGEQTYTTIESIKDTIVEGQMCRKLYLSGLFCGSYGSSICYVYSKDDIVYFYDKKIGEFQILYNFNTIKNDYWKVKFPIDNGYLDSMVVTVDSVFTEKIKDINLKGLYVKYSSFSVPEINYKSKIIERIGDFNYLFNFYSSSIICDANFSEGLRCYEDNIFGLYSTGIADSCTYRYVVGVNDNKLMNDKLQLTISPNPVNQSTVISYQLPLKGQVRLIVYDFIGREVELIFDEVKDKGDYTLKYNAVSLKSGIYFIKLQTDDGSKVVKFVKN